MNDILINMVYQGNKQLLIFFFFFLGSSGVGSHIPSPPPLQNTLEKRLVKNIDSLVKSKLRD